MGFMLRIRLFQSTHEGWTWLWYLWTHSPFLWVPEAAWCMRKVVWTVDESLDPPEPSLSISDEVATTLSYCIQLYL